jgi:hypothetical protein
MLVPGVLPGSKGPLLYPPDEVRKSPEDWNHIPIVVYHPMKDGKPVSARSPSILSKHGIGIVFHARTDGKDILKSEGWLDVEATRRVDKSVLDSVQLGKPIELSTGLFVDDEPAPEGAIFNDHRGTRKYVGIARNYKPDHLAILPSGKGACSLADGCGVLINETAMEAYQVIINELEAEAVSLYFPDLDLDLLTANKFNPNQPRDKSGKWATVAAATKKVEKAQGRVTKAQAALEKAKATLKVEKSGLLTAKKGLSEAKAREKTKSPAASNAIEKAKASTETTAKAKTTRTSPAESKKAGAEGLRLAEQFSTDLKAVSDSNGHHHDRELAKRTADELNKTATRMGKPELLDVLDTFTQGISRKVYEKRSATALRSELGRVLSSVYGATLRSTAASESGIASKPSNPRAHGMGKATGGSPSATGTPTAPKPAASPGARTGKGSKVAHSIVAAINGGASNLKEAYNTVKKDHPGLTLGQFHDHVKSLHESGHIQAQSYNKHLASLPSNEHAIYHKNRVLYDVTPGANTAPVKSTVEHKSLPKNLTDKLAAFVSDARSKNSFDTPSIARAHEHLRQFAPHITEGQLHDVVRQAHAEGKVRLNPYTQAPATIGASEKPFYMDRDIKNFLDAGPNLKAGVGTATSPRAGAKSKSSTISPSTGKPAKSVDHHIEKTKNLLAQSLSVDKATVKAHVDQMGKDLNKAQVLEVAKSIGLGGKQKTKKDALKTIHDVITAQKGVYTRGLE